MTKPDDLPARTPAGRAPRFAWTLALIGGLTAGLAACGSTTPIRYHTLLAPATIGTPAAGAPATGAPFLIEVLPRVLLATDLAPKGTPILADDGMPAQHYSPKDSPQPR